MRPQTPPALLVAGIDEPAGRLIWATVEQSLADLRNQRQHNDAAAFLADVLPALAPGIDAGAVDDAISRWTTERYDRSAAARQTDDESGMIRHATLHLRRKYRP